MRTKKKKTEKWMIKNQIQSSLYSITKKKEKLFLSFIQEKDIGISNPILNTRIFFYK